MGPYREQCRGWHVSLKQPRIKREAFPWIGCLPLAEITTPLQVLRHLGARGLLENAQGHTALACVNAEHAE